MIFACFSYIFYIYIYLYIYIYIYIYIYLFNIYIYIIFDIYIYIIYMYTSTGATQTCLSVHVSWKALVDEIVWWLASVTMGKKRKQQNELRANDFDPPKIPEWHVLCDHGWSPVPRSCFLWEVCCEPYESTLDLMKTTLADTFRNGVVGLQGFPFTKSRNLNMFSTCLAANSAIISLVLAKISNQFSLQGRSEGVRLIIQSKEDDGSFWDGLPWVRPGRCTCSCSESDAREMITI